MTQEERDNILLDLKNDFGGVRDDVQNLKNDMQSMKDDMQSIKDDIQDMKDDMQNINDDMQNMKDDMQSMKDDMQDMKDDIRNLNRSVAKIEVEHGEKLDILFDYFVDNSKRFESQDKKIESLNKIVTKHSAEIYSLNSKVSNI